MLLDTGSADSLLSTPRLPSGVCTLSGRFSSASEACPSVPDRQPYFTVAGGTTLVPGAGIRCPAEPDPLYHSEWRDSNPHPFVRRITACSPFPAAAGAISGVEPHGRNADCPAFGPHSEIAGAGLEPAPLRLMRPATLPLVDPAMCFFNAFLNMSENSGLFTVIRRLRGH